MKKLFITIALVMTAIFTLTGCGLGGGGGCSGGSVGISYNTAWTNVAEDTLGLKESLTYSVDYQDDLTIGKVSYKNTIDKTKIDFSYGKGTYTTTLTVVKAEKSLLGEKSSEVLNAIVDSTDQSVVKRLYKYETSLSIPFSYKYGDMTETVTTVDTIKTESYFLLSDNAYAPVYSKSEYNMSFVGVGKETFVERQHYDTETIYNLDKATTSTTVYYTKTEGENLEGAVADQRTTEAKYSYKSVIDNTSLLFVMRSISLGDTGNTLGVYTHVYTTPKKLNITAGEAQAEKYNITLNGNAIPEEEIQLNAYSFVLNTAKGCSSGPNTGRSQIVYTNKNGETPYASIGSNRTMVMRYIEPLIEYQSYLSMGALVYSLTEINF